MQVRSGILSGKGLLNARGQSSSAAGLIRSVTCRRRLGGSARGHYEGEPWLGHGVRWRRSIDDSGQQNRHATSDKRKDTGAAKGSNAANAAKERLVVADQW